MKILFHSNQLGYRGTEVALIDYAKYNEEILGHESVIAYDRVAKLNCNDVIANVKKRFDVIDYTYFPSLHSAAEKCHIDLAYFIKAGTFDGKITMEIPSAVHMVFPTTEDQYHGDRIAFISPWLSHHCTGNLPSVPFIVTRPDIVPSPLDVGQKRTDFVIGSYGASTSFNVDFVRATVNAALESRSDLFFIFMNYDKFLEHPRCRFLPRSTSVAFKQSFVATCDAMLHARRNGETFGLACAEFSAQNKPVMTYDGADCEERAHLDILGENCYTYDNAKELLDLLTSLTKQDIGGGCYDMYARKFSPETVMSQFKDVFITGPVSNFSHADNMSDNFNAKYYVKQTMKRIRAGVMSVCDKRCFE